MSGAPGPVVLSCSLTSTTTRQLGILTDATKVTLVQPRIRPSAVAVGDYGRLGRNERADRGLWTRSDPVRSPPPRQCPLSDTELDS